MKTISPILFYSIPLMVIADLYIAHMYYSYGFQKIAAFVFITAVVWIVVFFFGLSHITKDNGKHNT
jgi:hypothetical protein